MPRNLDVREVVKGGPPQRTICHVERGGTDDIHTHAQAGGQAQDRPGVLRDVGLIEGNAHAGGRITPTLFRGETRAGKAFSTLPSHAPNCPPPRPSRRLVRVLEQCKKNARQNVLWGSRRPSSTIRGRPDGTWLRGMQAAALDRTASYEPRRHPTVNSQGQPSQASSWASSRGQLLGRGPGQRDLTRGLSPPATSTGYAHAKGG